MENEVMILRFSIWRTVGCKRNLTLWTRGWTGRALLPLVKTSKTTMVLVEVEEGKWWCCLWWWSWWWTGRALLLLAKTNKMPMALLMVLRIMTTKMRMKKILIMKLTMMLQKSRRRLRRRWWGDVDKHQVDHELCFKGEIVNVKVKVKKVKVPLTRIRPLASLQYHHEWESEGKNVKMKVSQH